MTLPKGWVETTLGECQGRTSSLDPRREPDTEFDLFSVPAHAAYEPDRALGSAIGSAKQNVQPGDVLLCKIVPHIRRGWVVPAREDRPQIASGEWIVFRDHALDPEFLRRFVVSNGFHDQFMQTLSGVGGSLMRARPADAASISVPVPPAAEQRRIVAKLDALTARLTRARAELDRVPVLAAKLRRECLDEVFSSANLEGSDPYSFDEVVSDGLIGLVRSRADQGASGAPYLRMGHYDLDGRFNENDFTAVHCSPAELRRFELRAGDLLFNTRNSVELVGKVALWPEGRSGWVFNNNILRLRFHPNILPRFAFRYMISPGFRSMMAEKTSATTSVAAIYQRSLYATPFPVPSLDRQQAIVDFIDAAFARADRLEAEAARARALLDWLEAAILARAFRGELVPQDSADEPASVLLDRIRAQRAAAPRPKRGRAVRADA